MDSLINQPDPYLNRQLTDLEIAEELIGFLFAGSGTAANTTIFLIWSVARDERIRRLLVEELDAALPSQGEVDYAVVTKLSYLNAMIMEALRRYPTIPGTQPRIVVGKDVTVAGYKIPVGVRASFQTPTELSINPSMRHRQS
jgi:benzoate 4-monooxygenase